MSVGCECTCVYMFTCMGHMCLLMVVHVCPFLWISNADVKCLPSCSPRFWDRFFPWTGVLRLAEISSQLALRNPFLPPTPWNFQAAAIFAWFLRRFWGSEFQSLPLYIKRFIQFPTRWNRQAEWMSGSFIFFSSRVLILLWSKGSADADLRCHPLEEGDQLITSYSG